MLDAKSAPNFGQDDDLRFHVSRYQAGMDGEPVLFPFTAGNENQASDRSRNLPKARQVEGSLVAACIAG